MPKRILLALALAAFGLAACNSGYNGVPVNTGPTPTPTPYVPNPNITSLTVSVTVLGSPAPGLTVVESTPDPSNRPGTPIATATTDPTGKAKFTGLTPSQAYCWQTTYTNAGPPPANQTFTACTLFWQSGIALGN